MLNETYHPLKLLDSALLEKYDITQKLQDVLEQLDLNMGVEECTISRIDFTCDLKLDCQQELLEYVRILKKSGIKSSFKRVEFTHNSKSVLDYKVANAHSYTIHSDQNVKYRSPRITFKAYDKIYELMVNERCAKKYQDQTILRLELTLSRSEFRNQLKINQHYSLDKQLNIACEKAESLLRKFMKKHLYPTGRYLRYEDAKQCIEDTAPNYHKEKMLFLLQKTSDSANLSNAILKLREKYNLSKKSADTVLHQFEKLKLSPVTLPNRSELDKLSSLSRLL